MLWEDSIGMAITAATAGIEGWHALRKMKTPTFSFHFLDEMKADEMHLLDEDER